MLEASNGEAEANRIAGTLLGFDEKSFEWVRLSHALTRRSDSDNGHFLIYLRKILKIRFASPFRGED
jgi:hypothetical protein